MEFGLSEEEVLKIEEHNIWKKNSPQLYDVILTQELEWPSVSVQWFPEKKTSADHYSTQRLLMCTNTSGADKEYIIIADVKMPTEALQVDASKYCEKGEVGGFGLAEGGIDIIDPENTDPLKKTNAIYIPTEAAVNKARYMPQNPDLIACRTDFSDVILFDRTRHGSGKPKDSKCEPLLRLKGHTKEGYALSWSNIREGYVISGGNDMQVNLYDVAGLTSSDHSLSPLRIYNAHKNVVNDVCFSGHHDYMFGSASDDNTVLVWDSREESSSKSSILLRGHKSEVQCLSFNPFTEHLVATGCVNSEVVLWDLRKPDAPQHTMLGHTDQVLSINWSPFSETILGTSSKDRRMIVWNIAQIGAEQDEEDADIAPEVMFIHSGHLDEVSDFSWNGNDEWLVASVSADNIVQIWQMSEAIYGDEEEGEEKDNDLE